MTYYAHSIQGSSKAKWQLLSDHLANVAARASIFAEKFQSKDFGAVAGLLHDIGKYTQEFQARLEGDPARVDHSTAGGRYAVEEYGPVTGKLLAYAVAGHHGGLPDGYGGDASALNRRLEKNTPQPILSEDFILPSIESFPFRLTTGFQLAFWLRMLYSCLVDSDYLDTELFLQPDRQRLRYGYPAISELLARLNAFVVRLTESAPDTPVNRVRNEILSQAREAAAGVKGLFSFTVPTGGGKTLSSLSFALEHAVHHELDRVIYAIPYTSIIEQNAAVFRQALGDDAVLEHHSNFDSRQDERSNLAAENWDAPLVVTTNVQFFESLLGSRPSRCRKLHNIVNSVIILDEAQMIPRDYLMPCLEVLRELKVRYGCTVMLCTATQPAVRSDDLERGGLESVREIVSDPEKYFSALKRVNIEYSGKIERESLAAAIRQRGQALCIVNTRREAARLFGLLAGEDGIYHLSASMCPAHRSQKLDAIRRALKEGEECRVVSTQLVEAGVDIDFPVVYRSMAGIDSVAQAAGRCNREGLMTTPGEVIVYDSEAHVPPGHLKQSADAAREIARNHTEITGTEAVREYFRLLYWQAGRELDRKDILQRLNEGRNSLSFQFREIARDFSFIESGMDTVIIPFNEEAERLIDKLRDETEQRYLARALQRYAVQIYPNQFELLAGAGQIETIDDRYNILREGGVYADDLGLQIDNRATDPENLIF